MNCLLGCPQGAEPLPYSLSRPWFVAGGLTHRASWRHDAVRVRAPGGARSIRTGAPSPAGRLAKCSQRASGTPQRHSAQNGFRAAAVATPGGHFQPLRIIVRLLSHRAPRRLRGASPATSALFTCIDDQDPPTMWQRRDSPVVIGDGRECGRKKRTTPGLFRTCQRPDAGSARKGSTALPFVGPPCGTPISYAAAAPATLTSPERITPDVP